MFLSSSVVLPSIKLETSRRSWKALAENAVSLIEELTFCVDQNSDTLDYRLLTVYLFKVFSNAHFGSLKHSSSQARCRLLLLDIPHGNTLRLTTSASDKISLGLSEENQHGCIDPYEGITQLLFQERSSFQVHGFDECVSSNET